VRKECADTHHHLSAPAPLPPAPARPARCSPPPHPAWRATPCARRSRPAGAVPLNYRRQSWKHNTVQQHALTHDRSVRRLPHNLRRASPALDEQLYGAFRRVCAPPHLALARSASRLEGDAVAQRNHQGARVRRVGCHEREQVGASTDRTHRLERRATARRGTPRVPRRCARACQRRGARASLSHSHARPHARAQQRCASKHNATPARRARLRCRGRLLAAEGSGVKRSAAEQHGHGAFSACSAR